MYAFAKGQRLEAKKWKYAENFKQDETRGLWLNSKLLFYKCTKSHPFQIAIKPYQSMNTIDLIISNLVCEWKVELLRLVELLEQQTDQQLEKNLYCIYAWHRERETDIDRQTERRKGRVRKSQRKRARKRSESVVPIIWGVFYKFWHFKITQ